MVVWQFSGPSAGHGLLERSGSREPKPMQRSHFRHAHAHVRFRAPSSLAASLAMARQHHRCDRNSLRPQCSSSASSRGAALRVECASRSEACRIGRRDRAGQRRAAFTPSTFAIWRARSRVQPPRAQLCCSTQKQGAAVFLDEGRQPRALNRAFPPALATERACGFVLRSMPGRARSSRTWVFETEQKRGKPRQVAGAPRSVSEHRAAARLGMPLD